jgi:STE24 endopeptidase
MTPFDPKAATEAMLSALPQAARLKAVHYTQGGHWLILGGWLVSLLAFFLIARSGALRSLENRLGLWRRRPLLFAFLAAAVFALLDLLIELPWSIYADWWREKAYGLTSQPFQGWLGELMINGLIDGVLGGLFFIILYALMRRAPRAWWLWAGALASAFIIVIVILAPVLIEPIFNTYTPAPPGPTREAVVELAKAAGVPSDKIFIYNGSKQSNRYTANVSGLLGSARVAMSDVMFAKGADIAEVRGVVGHEMGHYKRGHIFIEAIILGLLALAFFGLANLLFPFAERFLKTGSRSIADPVGLPALFAVLTTLVLISTPMRNTLTRLLESDADAFSLRVAHEPDGLAKALVKTSEYRADSPSDLEEFIFYDHPSVRRRVQRAMDWKAAHLDLATAQAARDAGAAR